ncbi:MAG: site-specific integrase [Lachnospiraceae bacterium]|nr:site-specific integrase [Lachnospiraceae bacterium]
MEALKSNEFFVDHFNHLSEQMDLCKTVTGKHRKYVENFLLEQGIQDIGEIDDFVKKEYRNKIINDANLSDRQKVYYKNTLELFQLYYLLPFYPFIKKYVIDNEYFQRTPKNKLAAFLMERDIDAPEKIDYDLRKQYQKYLKNTVAKSKILEYLKVLDQVKLNFIKKEKEENLFEYGILTYKNEKLFLLYHPDYEIAKTFYYIRDKEELLFDFSINTSAVMKRQIFKMLNHILLEITDWHERRQRFLIPLKKFYQFCRTAKIADIEQITKTEIDQYKMSLRKEGKIRIDADIQIVDHIRKYLFLNAKETNWDANAWYMERFHFAFDRMNPSNPVVKIEFNLIENEEHRAFFKEYMRYLIGITQEALQNIRCQYYSILDFLKYCESYKIKISYITNKNVKMYISYLDKKDVIPATYNRTLIAVFSFLKYMESRKRIPKIEISLEYYLKKELYSHHDRSVSLEDQIKILTKLSLFPMHLRLMYLHLWCIGLRVNEVCTITADAYEWDGETAWFRIYQNKMKAEKKVPIPRALYILMDQYIRQMERKEKDYVFQTKNGNPYKTATLVCQMQRYLDKAGISKEEFHFKSHDFRHTMATSFYVNGTSIQAIRDYLGHKTEEMTKAYIDYIPQQIREKNKLYFADQRNELSYLERGDKR